ncbi:translation initiation factor IF-3 [Helicobacter pylori Hp P-8b]|uniref:Translation initiation factor IF-3 n=1 Tax=Helicobacter pylori Hp P-4 TaxID=992075 RepID=I9WIT6_HELPX|nr:transcription initiation factor 3 [Helicobacter pylori 908]ADZ49209.1 Transcription initiation factor 3 [Helicobacter pylori 2017]ADZ50808.1 Translation initiation factor 3 [Helicobacter pylori 2018]EJB67199.1 translation initiation factor IF-3 [Helicobacter pylori Hp H-44]EJB69493.1 translation initiation factor IF-3 [Helicobacter pylori Hp A-8]EJC03855.1 translation initiation factor IF-3 [Helicobacter pylori Hp P-4]EJC04860.1 translation initiation factor IF-3 [Helicobacter pylori Hp P-
MLNGDINFKEVRCVGDDGEVYGIISSKEALKIAQNLGLDLVLISASAKPPVCKVMDYNKFRYQNEKKIKEAKKKQKQIEIKEIKLSTQIAQNDINYKVKHAREFIEANKHVKFKVVLKGRESQNSKAGLDVLLRVQTMMEDLANPEKEPKTEGRFVSWMFVPKAKEAPKNEKKPKENNPPFNRINLMKGENHAKNED